MAVDGAGGVADDGVGRAATVPLFECEGLAEVVDLVSLRRLSVWLSAAEDEHGQAYVYLDLAVLDQQPTHDS